MNATELFARNLRHRRHQAGLSQEALADLCSMHRTEISLLERAEREPRLGTIVKVSQALGVSVAEMLDGVA